jgi:hypothetical protein
MAEIEMSLEEIQAANVNPLVAREAHDQSAKRLADALDTKRNYEQKAFTLFSGYLTASLAVCGILAAIYKDHGMTTLATAFAIAAILLIGGVTCFVLALKEQKYGTLGSSPDMWLRRGVIDGQDLALSQMLAYVTVSFPESRTSQN